MDIFFWMILLSIFFIWEVSNILSARFYVSGQNLAIITKYPGPDPEVSSNGNGNVVNQGLGSGNLNPGVDRNTLPNGRTLTVGLNVNF